VNNYYDRLGFITGLTVMVLAAQPSVAAQRQITGIDLESKDHQVELKLTTNTQDSQASFVTIRRGNVIEANLLNTELKLPQKSNFTQDNPLPGIQKVEVNSLDREHTKIAITIEPGADIDEILKQQGKDILLSLNEPTTTQKFYRGFQELSSGAIDNLKETYHNAIASKQTKNDEKPVSKSSANSDGVLIPNPDIVITNKDGTPTIANNSETYSQSAPTRAVAPPVGDMAVSNINAEPDTIDLGSDALVPRLVLRDAPVREVLSLLARSAGLNIVFATSEGESGNGQEGNGQGAAAAGPTISLDLENQPVQEVFNSVLLMSNLNANRKGSIIYVGEKLPAQARNLVSRTLRLNQVRAENAALFLATQGATGQRLSTETEETIDPETGKVVQRIEKPATLEEIGISGEGEESDPKALLLKGLQVSTDGRLNSLTLVGEPRKVEVAVAFLTQLDARRRQVAVNVKVIDLNLLNQDVFNSSFSFGINDSFFTQDNGAATLRFGETSPATSADLNSPTGRASNPPVINNPFAGADTFIDFNNTTSIPGTLAGLVDNEGNQLIPRGAGDFFNRVAGVGENPLEARTTDFTLATDRIRTITTTNGTQTVTVSPGTDGTATAALPSLFQYPRKFLALLEARITSGNAKILTDPTLVVQEGQQASVKLTQKIVESVNTSIDGDSGARTITPVIGEAGVTLTVNVEGIDDNGFVSLSVSPKVSSIGATQEFDSGGGATNTLNLLSVRETASGLIRLRDGQTLILSGIIQDQERNTVSKVPILGDIPLLGSLFRSSDKTNERAEVIVLLTPEVVDEQSDFGYDYTPGKESRELLEKSGVELPGNP
jgi:type IV pilus assembly protein PilQ